MFYNVFIAPLCPLSLCLAKALNLDLMPGGLWKNVSDVSSFYLCNNNVIINNAVSTLKHSTIEITQKWLVYLCHCFFDIKFRVVPDRNAHYILLQIKYSRLHLILIALKGKMLKYVNHLMT